MNNLRPLRASDLNAHIIIQTLQEKIEHIDKIHVVTFNKNGMPTIYTSGSLAEMALASLALQEAVQGRIQAK